MCDFCRVRRLCPVRRLCLVWRWRLYQPSTSPLMLARLRRAVFLAMILLMVLAWQVISRWRQARVFPKVFCPDSSRRSLPTAAQRGITDGDATPHPMHQVHVPMGNWSFKAPQHMASICHGDATGAKPLLALVPVTKSMTAERETIRRTWGSELNSQFGQLLFLIQLPSDEPADSGLTAEFAQHRDLLLAFCSSENCEDSYRLLVRKVAAGLRWYALECRVGFDFVLKADHDSYWNVASLLRLLQRHRPSEPLILGSIQEGAAVTRDSGSKFFTPTEVFRRDKFPTYASGGPGYALSRSAAVVISELATRAPLKALWLEDVYLTGLLPEAALASCANSSAVGSDRGLHVAASGRFLYLHSSYIFICPYAEFTPLSAHNWPPLAMHRVQGRALVKLHSWMQAPGVRDRRHTVLYSSAYCHGGRTQNSH